MKLQKHVALGTVRLSVGESLFPATGAIGMPMGAGVGFNSGAVWVAHR